mmetsp:Transcript_96562/g.166450  ORF Transcript_96562/g.166450 Transcript_96562/m.166450 type:complete len:246 (-) Transcript_96562:943-1680(-)
MPLAKSPLSLDDLYEQVQLAVKETSELVEQAKKAPKEAHIRAQRLEDVEPLWRLMNTFGERIESLRHLAQAVHKTRVRTDCGSCGNVSPPSHSPPRPKFLAPVRTPSPNTTRKSWSPPASDRSMSPAELQSSFELFRAKSPMRAHSPVESLFRTSSAMGRTSSPMSMAASSLGSARPVSEHGSCRSFALSRAATRPPLSRQYSPEQLKKAEMLHTCKKTYQKALEAQEKLLQDATKLQRQLCKLH